MLIDSVEHGNGVGINFQISKKVNRLESRPESIEKHLKTNEFIDKLAHGPIRLTHNEATQ